MTIIKVSVRNLVEFILRTGDIDNRQAGGMQIEAMKRGSQIHRKLQKKAGPLYHAEVPLKMEFQEENYIISIEGRADGLILKDEDGAEPDTIIDEIKGVYADISHMTEPVAVHLAQAKCYAWIYATQNEKTQMGVRMTYVNLDTEELRYFHFVYSYEELEAWFQSLMGEYKKWADFQYEWRQIRQASIQKLQFPYPYRKGQKKLVEDVYRTILRQKNLFIQAPTGTGKTLSTLFPAVMAMGQDLGEKLFYLTAKTVTAAVAKETFALFEKYGYRAKTVQIMAKEKLCPWEETSCNPVDCPYAKGHYDRVNEAVFALLHQTDMFSRERLLEHAQAYRVCPFEMCLDTASWSDNIICDYNYVFDPRVYLKRFFAEGNKGSYLFLADEAHNLVERARNMYSAKLYKEDFLAVKKLVKTGAPKLQKGLQACNKILLEYKKSCETFQYHDDIDAFLFALMRLAAELESFLHKHREWKERDAILEFYFEVRSFLETSEGLDENYVIYSEHTEDGRFLLCLFCVDPSRCLQERLDKARSTIFFSATLLPIQYYKSLLSTQKDNYAVYAETVFEPDQKCLLIGADVTSKYTRRGPAEYEKIARYILQSTIQKNGNYMVFCPSYKFMEEIYTRFVAEMPPDMECVAQTSGMKEEDRKEFLELFEEKREHTLVAFCVMGGIFAEGIDLKEEQLIGAMIVGTGLPQVGNEREILKQFYDGRSGNGFDYAYRYPGMNKVLQAAGRVIRTVNDVGVIELLDERFLQSDYRSLFPREWADYQTCNLDNVADKLREFWERKDSHNNSEIKF